MTNLKTKKSHFAKSKILLVILCLFGLAFSYSCNCRNNSTAPDDGNGGNGGSGNGGNGGSGGGGIWTFAPAFNLANKYDIAFGESGNLKLNVSVKFTEADKHDIKTIKIEEITDPQKVFASKDKIQYNDDGTFSIANADLQTLAGKLTSTDKPATNKVTIVFKLTSTNDTSTENNKFLTNTFNFVKAKKIDKSNIQGILRKGDNIELATIDPPVKKLLFDFKNGIYSDMGNEYTIKNSPTDDYDNIPKSRVKTFIGYNFSTVLTNEGIYGKPTANNFEEGGGENSSFYALSYDITYGDFYEGDITLIKVKLDNQSSLKFVE